MSSVGMRPCGDYKTDYGRDQTIFETTTARNFVIAGIVLACLMPLVADRYVLSLMIQISYLGIAALCLNILVGFTGQISIGHAAFFGFGAFTSAYLNNHFAIPVFFCIPLAGLATAVVGFAFGLPAARIKGLYLAIATLAAQYILEDFFARSYWFTGGPSGSIAQPFTLFGFSFDSDRSYFYVVLAYTIVAYLLATNLMRSRDGRALVAVRDHYLSAEMMGINLTKYRTLSFAIAAFLAGIGGALYAHYLSVVSSEGFNLLLSVQFLAMVIIGGLGSILGSLLGTVFMVLLPEAMDAGTRALSGTWIDTALGLKDNVVFLRDMAIGAVIIGFLIFEPDGLAHRWRQIKAYWKLYPFSY